MDGGGFFFDHVDDDDDDGYLIGLGLLSPPPPVAAVAAAGQYLQCSAFAAYEREAVAAPRQYSAGAGGGANVHRRMHVYLRSVRDGAGAGEACSMEVQAPAPRSSRFRHIMRERLRRERLSQGFADLRALLPPGRASKGAKNFIVGAAAGYIRELEGRKRWLHARNEELRRAAPATSGGCGAAGEEMVVKVRAEESDEHPSSVDVFEVVLRRLKAMGELRVTGIRSCFCAGEMSMDVGVESKISSRAVGKAISDALMELEEIKSSSLQDPTSGKSSFSCQIESGVLTG